MKRSILAVAALLLTSAAHAVENPDVNQTVVCKQEAKAKGLKGNDAKGYVAICMAEKSLECTKEAVAAGRKVGSYVRSCLGYYAPVKRAED